MTVDGLIWQTRERFPHLDHTPVEILPLEKGGSDRRYYRIRFSPENTLILVKYNSEKVENQRFVGIASFLCGIGVNAPSIYHHDPQQGLIWMQDLGEEDLWHHRGEPDGPGVHLPGQYPFKGYLHSERHKPTLVACLVH